jgi:hypothetical protein
VHRLARRLLPDIPHAGLYAVVLFAAMPMSVITGMAYPEGLLLGLVGWALVGMVEQRWLLVGPCVVAAGYVSPMALPLIAVTVVAGFAAALRVRDWWWPCAAAIAAPWGTVGYVVWVSATTGGTASYLSIQRAGWGSHIDYGAASARFLWQAVATDTTTFTAVTAAVTVAAVVLAVLLVRARPPWPVWVYTAATLAFILGTAGIQFDHARLLLSAFPALLPLVRIAGRRRPHVAWGLVSAVGVVGLWFGAYSLTAWRYGI